MNRETIFALIRTDAEVIRAVLDGATQTASADKKLQTLTIGCGHVAVFINDAGWSQCHLRRVFGFCVGWLTALGIKDPIPKINAERDRQDKLFVEGNILFNCASRTVDVLRKLRVFTEEVGEVAKAIDQLEVAESRRSLALKEYRLELKLEITQVAAVAVAWLEALEAPATKKGK